MCCAGKTSHQAISHRVKSVTMSNWTDDEVNELMDENGGGNAACQHIWLAKAPAYGGRYHGGARPREGDRIEVFKKFVMDCYDTGMFRADTPYTPQVASSESQKVSSSASHSATTTPSTSAKLSKPSQPVTADLFSFDSDPFSSSSAPAAPPASSSSFGDFAQFGSAPVAQPLADPFGFSSAPQERHPMASSTQQKPVSRPVVPATQPTVKAAAEVDLLSYEPIAAPAPAQKQKDNSLLDLLSLDSALPAAPAPTGPSLSIVPPASLPAPAMAANDPFGNMPDLLRPSPVASYPAMQSSPMSSGSNSPMMGMSSGSGRAMGGMGMPMGMPMGGMQGMGYPQPNAAPRPMMVPAMGGYSGGMSPMMQQQPSSMMTGNRYGNASPMAPMGGTASAISALGTQPQPFRAYPGPGPAASAQPDKFSYIQETMKKHLENPMGNR